MDILSDAFFDALKLLPILFILYLIVEYVEHKNNNLMNHILMNSKKGGPLIGALLGCVPQCGFSVIASNLYSKHLVTIGTLIAVFISTSDEAIPILLSKPEFLPDILKILFLKFVFAVVCGFVADIFINTKIDSEHICHDEKEHTHFHGNCEKCEDGILKSAIIHSVKIFAFIFAVNIILGFIIQSVGEEQFGSFLMTNKIFQPFASSLIGLIPNCAASCILTQLYINGGITFGSLVGGLCTGAGVGMVVLFKVNRPAKNNLLILFSVFIIGVVFGTLIQCFM